MIRRLTQMIAIGLCLFPAAAWAGASEGGAFRLPGYGARAWAMGGAAIATIDDEGAVYWNPALLSSVPGDVVGASYINLVEGATAHHSELAYVHVLSTRLDEGGAPVHRHVVGAMYTNLSLDLAGGASYNENHLRLAYAYTPEDLITFGATFRVFTSSSGVANFDAFGTAVDGSARLKLSRNLILGFVARDAFSRYSYDYSDGRNPDYQVKRGYTVGLGYRGLSRVALEGDLVFDNGGLARSILGGETDYLLDYLALRAGVAHLRSGNVRVVPYLGFGFRFSQLTLHYNANLDSEDAFGTTHRFSLSVTL